MTTTPTATDPLAFAKSIEGWMSPDELRWIYETGRMFAGGRVVEVGVWKGRSLAAWAAGMEDGMLVGVDNMSGRHSWSAKADVLSQRHDLDATTSALIVEHSDLFVDIIERDSVAAAESTPAGLDCVFIDGDHRAGYVEADILAWFPLVRHLGIIAGHDYNEPGVRATVDKAFGGKVERPAGSIWYHVKLSD